MKYNLLIILVFLLNINSFSQVKIDSLWNVWSDESKADTIRLKALDNFIYEGYLETKNDSALYYSTIQIAYAKEKGIKEYIAIGQYNLGRAYKHKGELYKAINYYQKSFKLFKEQGNKTKIALSLYRIGGVYWTKGDYEQSKVFYKKSLTISKELDDKKNIAKCLNSIAYCFFNQGDLDTAMKLDEQCLKIYEELGDDHGIAYNLNAMGVYYSRQGNDEKALAYYLRGLEINRKIGARLKESYSLRNIGHRYSNMGDDEKALEYYKKCLVIDKELNNKRSLSLTYSSLGYFYLDQGNKEKAMEYFQRSLALSQELGNREMESSFLIDIGEIYLDIGNNNFSISECKKGYDIALETGSVPLQLKACECLYKAQKKLKSYSKALLYNEKMLVLNDSLNVKSLNNSLQKMEYTRQIFADSLLHEEDKLKVEMAHQTELRKKKRNQNVFIGSGLILLLIAIGLWKIMRLTKKANSQLKIERDRAEQSELVKHQFLANMSHEIRTPMNAIKGMIDILLRRKPQTEQLTYLQSIKEASNSLLVIINDILDLSKIESDKIELESIPFSITEMLTNVYTIMQFKAEEKGLKLILDIPANIPSVLGDSMRLRQIIINLIGNAIKFTEKGIVTTKLVLEKEPNSPHITAHFTVSDTGIGIDEDKIEQVFNSFEQAYADTSRKYGGTGLGLSISKKLIKLHQGEIWVESKKGVGSQFHFSIPFIVNTETKNIKKKLVNPDIKNISTKLQGIKVLLVEDNEFNIVVAKEELEDAIKEVNVSVAENGAIAVDLVRNNDFDIVLMDVQMPVMNGYDATAAIRELSDDKSKIPIIAMTANVLKEEVVLCYKAGMNDFIGKPFEVEILIEKIFSLTNIKP